MMTREEKIQNILKATEEFIKEETENGTMTPEKYAYITAFQNSAVQTVA